MGLWHFVDVNSIEAYRRLGVDDPAFEEELGTKRKNVVRSSSARACKRIQRISRESLGGKKRRPNSDDALSCHIETGPSSSSGSDEDERPLALLFSTQT